MPVPCARLVRSVVVLRPLRGEGRDVGGRIDQRAHSCGGCGNGLLRHGAVLAGLRRAGSSEGASPPRKRASALRAVRPPSTRSSVPLTYDASSEARKATAAATSSGRPWRSAAGRRFRQVSVSAPLPCSRRAMAESIKPRTTVLARLDRKSVVRGKGGSVRVDHGGD